MRPSPVQPRGGFTALPNDLLARALGELTADQLRLLVGIFYEAEFKAEGTTAGTWRVGFGQALVSYEGLAERYSLGVDAVRRALRRFGSLGITIRRAEPATSPATPPATQAAPIQHKNTRTPNTKKRSSAAASGDAPSEHRLLQVGLEEAFLVERGTPYGFQGGKDAKAISELLRLSSGDRNEVIRRWYRALRLGSKYPGTSTIAGLPGKWNELVNTTPSKGMAAPSTEWPSETREVNLVEPELWLRVLAGNDALPPDERWPGIREVRARDDGASGLIVLAGSKARADGLTAMGRASWISRLAGGAPVRIEAGL